MTLVTYKDFELKRTSVTANIPKNPMAHLSYYLKCVKSMSTFNIPEKLRDYHNYYMLTKEEEDQILILIAALSPDLLIEKKFMVVDESLCADSTNEFYEIVNRSKNTINKISFGGKIIESVKLMACNQDWIDIHYNEPKKLYADRILYISQRTLNL